MTRRKVSGLLLTFVALTILLGAVYLVGGRDGAPAVIFLVVVFGLLVASSRLTGIWTGGDGD